MWNCRFRSSNGHFNYEIRDRISSTFEGLATVFNRFMKSLALHSLNISKGRLGAHCKVHDLTRFGYRFDLI